MRALKRKETINKVLSILLIYALFFQEFIPFANAMNTIEFERSSVDFRYYGDIASDDNLIDAENIDISSESITPSNSEEIDISEAQQLALQVTSGPGQGESSAFSIGSTDGVVDKFTGDFNYSIPLMDVDGYPVTLNYNSNVAMHTDATWVGLGWNLNLGSISREMRGIPDEFNGDQSVTRIMNQKSDDTDGDKYGGYFSVGPSSTSTNNFAISAQITALFGSYDNSIVGHGRTMDIGLQASISISDPLYIAPTFGFGFSRDTKNGVGRNANIGLSIGFGKSGWDAAGSLSYGTSYNSRIGMTSKSLGLGVQGKFAADKFGVKASYDASTELSYGSITSVPNVMFKGEGSSENFGLDVFFGYEPAALLFKLGFLYRNYDIVNGIKYNNSTKTFTQPAFGYLHSGKRKNYTAGSTYPIMDFNRSGDFEYSEEMKNLAFSMQTFDVFRANAFGMSGTFRGRRNDVGTYYDPDVTNNFEGDMDDVTLGVKLGTTPNIVTFIAGYADGNQNADVESENWRKNGSNVIEFQNNSSGNQFDNKTYFKALGEPTPEDLSVYNAMGGSSAAYFDVNASGDEIVLENQLKGGSTATINSGTLNNSNGEAVKATCFNPRIAGDVVAETPLIVSYTEGSFLGGGQSGLGRTTGYRKANHISSIEITSTDGMQYTYGIPAYAISSSQIAFAAEGRPVNIATNLVRYSPGDNSVNNTLGRMNYYDKTTVPGYGDAFLLTEMKSSDYVDITGNGVSVDDVGSYYKLNYTQIYGDGSALGNYKWRFPVSDDAGFQAMSNQGFLGTKLDDGGNYSYGEKEIWYTHSVESKNVVAEFYYTNREDAYAVQDENGLLDTSSPLRALAKIVLYSRADRVQHGVNAIPLQTVEFDYDYSLCKNSASNKHTYSANLDYNKSGKLTLKGIRVYSGTSKEGGLAKYEFEYSAQNPDFSYGNTDSWGNYKANNTSKPNHLFPYVEQNLSTANNNLQSWKLVAINTPSGGRTEVDYEADSYATVQDKRAMRHFDVHRVTNLIEFLHLQEQFVQNGTSWNGTSNAYTDFRKDFGSNSALQSFFSSNGYSTGFFSSFFQAAFTKSGYNSYSEEFGKFKLDFVPNNVVIFKLDNGLDASAITYEDAAAQVKELYFRDPNGANNYLKEMFFKMHVRVKNDAGGSPIKEYIPMFADISRDYSSAFDNLLPYDDGFTAIGVMPPSPGGTYEYGYVVLDPVNSGARERKNKSGDDKDGVLLSPLQRTAVDYVRQNLPDRVFGSCTGCDPDLSIDWKNFFGGDMYEFMIEKGDYVSEFYTDLSTMRMYVSDNKKFGGTARVRQITHRDGWDAISGEYESSYSWRYLYPDRVSTSGVASYEPRVAIDENPWYEWDSYVNFAKKFPDETKFTPTPITNILFPIPTVGYDEVIVEFNDGMSKGYSKSEFFTSADYPTKEKVLAIDKSASVDKRNILSGKSVDLFGYSQGFVIETNDFHGKPKEASVYDALGNIQSRSTHYYNNITDKVKMIDRDGMVAEESIGMEYDIHGDSRLIVDKMTSRTIGATVSLKFVFPSPIPFPWVMPVFSTSSRTRGFYSHALIKHINRSAVLDRIETEYLGSINSAENLLYDKHTGSVLLSTLNDEYDDKLYSMNYPAHWYYDELKDVCNSNGKTYAMNATVPLLDLSSVTSDVFSPGDQLLLDNGASQETVWILEINGTDASLIDASGLSYSGLTGSLMVTIVKSGRNNRLNEIMQRLVTKKEVPVPLGAFAFPEQEILSGNALTYRNKNNVLCRSGEPSQKPNNEVQLGQPVNPFLIGVKGDLIMDEMFAWQSERKNDQHDHGIRFDGEFSTYVPLYKLNGSQDWKRINEGGVNGHPNHIASNEYQFWRDLGAVTLFDEYGKPREAKDQIEVYAAQLYGYNDELSMTPVASADNARKQEIAYDGFEDYDYYSNVTLFHEESHFDFRDALTPDVAITETYRHSGLSALAINPATTASVTKEVSDGCTVEIDGITNGQFIAEECLCIPPFEPTPGDYIAGVWVKLGNDNTLIDYSDAKLEVIVGSTTYSFAGGGMILDGWQRIEGEFQIPTSGITNIDVRLVNNSSTEIVYFDDLRIHPFLATMATTVYDPKTLLPMATHDGYNYTTFYNYDENLNKVRVRVETAEGIKTISEFEIGGQKKFN